MIASLEARCKVFSCTDGWTDGERGIDGWMDGKMDK